MTREEAINYLISSGFSEEQVNTIAKAFEPTTKNDSGVDAVSRKDVHDMLENLPVTVEDKWFNWLQKACMRLADLPSITPQEPKWIPVSEKLPEDYKTVIASVASGYVFSETRYSKEYGWEWAYESGADYWKELEDVTAWMPLPVPFDPQEREDVSNDV